MAKDLKELKQSGGLVAYRPEAVAVKTEQKKPVQEINIVVPDLTPAQPPNASAPGPVKTAASPDSQQINNTPGQSPKTQTTSSIGLLIVLIGTVIALGGSLLYWFVSKQNKPAPSPAPIISTIESPPPVKINPVIVFKNSVKTSGLIVEAASFTNDLQTHLDSEYPATTSLATITLLDSSQEYLTADSFIQLIAPESLQSFRASLDSNYALAIAAPKNIHYLAAVLKVKSQSLTTVQKIMTNWETANMESYFKPLWGHHGANLKAETRFINQTIEKHPFRTVAFNSQDKDLIFSYGFVNNYLIISTHATLTKTIISGLAL